MQFSVLQRMCPPDPVCLSVCLSFCLAVRRPSIHLMKHGGTHPRTQAMHIALLLAPSHLQRRHLAAGGPRDREAGGSQADDRLGECGHRHDRLLRRHQALAPTVHQVHPRQQRAHRPATPWHCLHDLCTVTLFTQSMHVRRIPDGSVPTGLQRRGTAYTTCALLHCLHHHAHQVGVVRGKRDM
jgi:hypothetical protein